MRKLIFGLLLALSMSAPHAATVTLVGDTITYEYDDVANAAALALFGVPTIIGDDVRFLPPNFRADSIDGIGVTTGTNTDSVSANFIFDRVYTNDGVSEIAEIRVVEFGDYEITNGDAPLPKSYVEADVLLTVSSNNNLFDFADSGDSFDAEGDSGGKQTWLMQASVMPMDEFFFDSANDVAVSLQNTLSAFTDANGERAWIQKKLSFVASTQPIVPVPAAVWLFGSALGLLGWVRRRQSH